MMRLSKFKYLAPRSVNDAAKMLADAGPTASVVAGGTDLYPNMKRRHQTPKTLIGLRRVEGMRGVSGTPEGGLRIGPMTTLTALERNATVKAAHPGLWKAVHSISTPILRNMGTLGGNICLDTRCNYYDQNYEWRRAINFCMKCDGDTCWVAPGSKVCLAVSSSDTAPLLCAIGARLHLVSATGEREIAAHELYRRDGIHFLSKRPDELLTEIVLPATNGWRSTYRKLRRREAFDFPVLGVGAWASFDGPVVKEARIFLGAVSPAPVEAAEAAKSLVGTRLEPDAVARASDLAYGPAKPVDNTDFLTRWRKEMTKVYVKGALEDLRGS
ncbi:MAG: FAD binding domain-containing protein [Planctomycetes bacterium]|nr:FAD binding domain-containing protein [Planctomycetota bacterium]